MPFSPKAFLFRRLIISLLISSIKIVGLILSIFCSLIVSILLRSTILVLGKNLAIKILAFIILLFIKGSLVDLLRFSR